MRIAFFYNLFPGGAQRVVYEQVCYLAKNHTVDVYTVSTKRDSSDMNPLDVASAYYVYPFDLASDSSLLPNRLEKDKNNFFALKTLQQKIAKDIDKKNYDIVVVHPDFYTQAPFLLQFLQTKSVYYCHEWLRIAYEKELAFTDDVFVGKKMYEYVTRAYRKYIDQKNAGKASFIITNSQFTKTHVQQAYGKDANVCYPGVDAQLFKPLHLKKEYDIFFVGGKDTINGYFFLQDILSLYKSALHVTYLQDDTQVFLSDGDLVKRYNKSKIVLGLSHNEPFGMVPLEAMSCEVPVIAVDEGGYRETIRHDQTGYLLKRDAKIFCDTIASVLKQQDKAESLGKQARQEVLKHWTWEGHTKKFEKMLQSFIQQ
jgi:glycosyltransferase involved in cell wall biosynthesis